VPELITPEHLMVMTDEAIEAHLSLLRTRRDKIKNNVATTKSRQVALTGSELAKRLQVHIDKLSKLLESVDKAIQKAEEAYIKIVALRLQHGDTEGLM